MKKFQVLMTMVLSAVMLSVMPVKSIAQEKKDVAEVKIKTSAKCDMCKERMEKALVYEKGIVSCDLDVATKVITVKYKPSKITVDAIRKIISMTGYQADDVKADPAAYEKLPACCKESEGHDEHKGCNHKH